MARVRKTQWPDDLYFVRGKKKGEYYLHERKSTEVVRMWADFATRKWTIEGYDLAFRSAPDAVEYLKQHGDLDDRILAGEYVCDWESFSVEKDHIIIDLKNGAQLILKAPASQKVEETKTYRRK